MYPIMLGNGIFTSDKHQQRIIFGGYFALMAVLYFALLPVMRHFVTWAQYSQFDTIFGLLLFCGIQTLKMRHLGVTRKALGFRLRHTREEIHTTLVATLDRKSVV